MASLWFLGVDVILHVLGVLSSGWPIICAVESRRINHCYVGRCGPLVIVSEFCFS